jgi:predicted glycosyltransferase involved in capsule biosynthesis
MPVPVLVPRREDGGRRDALWAWCKTWWESSLNCVIYEGTHDESETFSRSKAKNNAAKDAGDWEVALIVDGDVFLENPQQAVDAIKKAQQTRGMVYAHNKWRSLTIGGSDDVMFRGIPARTAAYDEENPNTFASVQAIHRELWDKVEGYDERFVGWGWEDLAFMIACGITGVVERVPGVVYHLHHPRSRAEQEEHPDYENNDILGHRYLDARWSKEKLAAIVKDRYDDPDN